MAEKVLLIEEEGADAGEPVRGVLAADGHSLTRASGWVAGWKQFEAAPPGMVIIALGANPKRGLALCSKIRAHPALNAVPVVLLGEADDLAAKERAFAAGADLYLAQPFEEKRLRLWVKAVLRRARSDEREGGLLRADDFTIDPQGRTVTTDGRTLRDLTPKEFALLYELVRRRPRALSKEFIMRSLWNSVLRDNTVEVHVWNLRKKLGTAGRRIVTVPKAGYRFR